MTDRRVAIVHDWLVTYGGAERVLTEMLRTFPQADLYALVNFLPAGDRRFLFNKQTTTSFIQKLPFARKKYRSYLPLMPLAIEQFDLGAYDIVLSSSFAVAKGVITGPKQLHICMCYSPMRYAWDLMHQYLKQTGLDRGLGSWLTRYMLHRLRIWDFRTSTGVDEYIAISRFIRRRIQKVYGRSSTVIYPPVSVPESALQTHKEDFYLTASRMVPYKRMDLIAEAFSGMPERKLVIIGDGPEAGRVRKKAGPNVTVMGYQPTELLRDKMGRARAFIFAAEEDFGIVPLEAQACGTPVIAYGQGGALETVQDGVTGLFFEEQSVASIQKAVEQFERNADSFDPERIHKHAQTFSVERFHREFDRFMADAIDKFFSEGKTPSFRRLSLMGRPLSPKPEK